MSVTVKRPKAIVFDILGTATKSGFLERILFPYLAANLEAYLVQNWSRAEFVKLYKRIELQANEIRLKDPNSPPMLPYDSSNARASLLAFINYVNESGANAPTVSQLRFRVWFEGYQRAKLQTPIYKDVKERLKHWFAEGIKFYVYSNTWVAAQQALLKNTNHGDLTNLISGHYDNDFGDLNSPDSWRRLCQDIREQPGDVLFLTKSVKEAGAAGESGLNVVLVLTHRHNVLALTREERHRYPFVRTLMQLNWLEGAMMPTGSKAGATRARPGSATQAGSRVQPSRTSTNTAIGSSKVPSDATGAEESEQPSEEQH